MSTREGPVGTLASVSIDCPDPDRLTPFYCGLLGLEEFFATHDRGVVVLSGAGPMVTLMRAETYVAPDWPDGPQRQQMHFDVAVDDLDAAVAAAVDLGATETEFQPGGQAWRVLLDPVGHPFCLSTVRPD
jgi:catechol 2,3-dioxygenase-like lactoylglutathione lyase family enzyme